MFPCIFFFKNCISSISFPAQFQDVFPEFAIFPECFFQYWFFNVYFSRAVFCQFFPARDYKFFPVCFFPELVFPGAIYFFPVLYFANFFLHLGFSRMFFPELPVPIKGLLKIFVVYPLEICVARMQVQSIVGCKMVVLQLLVKIKVHSPRILICIQIRLPRGFATMGQPLWIFLLLNKPSLTEFIMVAAYKCTVILIFELDQIINGFHGSAPSIHIIAQKNDMVLGRHPRFVHQLFQSPYSWMNVAHYQCPHRKVFDNITHKWLAPKKSYRLYHGFNPEFK